jgi:hypothetical protein
MIVAASASGERQRSIFLSVAKGLRPSRAQGIHACVAASTRILAKGEVGDTVGEIVRGVRRETIFAYCSTCFLGAAAAAPLPIGEIGVRTHFA